MIHRIRIENFYSIREAQELDLRVPGTTPDDPRFRPSPSRPDVRLPTVVALYGANASGKSTVLRAALSVMRFIVNSFDLAVDAAIPEFEPFLSEETLTQPTKIMMEFDAQWARDSDEPFLTRYELHLSNHGIGKPRTVAYEALHYAPKKHFVRIFERRDQVVTPGKPLGLKEDDPRLSVRPNASVIATLAKFNHDLATRIWIDVKSVPANFIAHRKSMLDEKTIANHYSNNPHHFEGLNTALRRIDAGLIAMNIYNGPNGPATHFIHHGLSHPIRFFEESLGTQNLVRNFPWLAMSLEGGTPIFMDELDNDLHTRVIEDIIETFHDTNLSDRKDPAQNPLGGQLFFTAHNPALMDVLEKEQIFFTEKDRTGATTLYGAKDIQGLRREPSLSRKYLGGVLGAVPNIG